MIGEHGKVKCGYTKFRNDAILRIVTRATDIGNG